MTTPTTTQIREAILKSADHLEWNPGLFYFYTVRIPDDDCGSPGCVLGWIAFFLSVDFRSLEHVAESIGCKRTSIGFSHDFYLRMDSLVPPSWREDVALCAKGLRAYADKFHPETETYPEVQAELERIFAEEVVA